MSMTATVDDLRDQATSALRKLAGLATDDEVNDAKALVERLRNVREYEFMGKVAEAVSRRDPKDAKNRRLYAQYLIDTGKATAAIDLLRPLAQRLSKDHPEHAEATGLLGRAYKQIFFDAGDKTSAGARDALKNAIESYRRPFEDNVNNTWHGVNLVALLNRARRLGLRVARDLDSRDVATRVVRALEATPENQRDEWYLPTLAEASLGLGDWSRVEANIKKYADVSNQQTPAFLIASTLRQFTQVWDLEQVDDRGRQLLDILRARLVSTPDGTVDLTPEQLRSLQSLEQPDESQLQAGPGTRGSGDVSMVDDRSRAGVVGRVDPSPIGHSQGDWFSRTRRRPRVAARRRTPPPDQLPRCQRPRREPRDQTGRGRDHFRSYDPGTPVHGR